MTHLPHAPTPSVPITLSLKTKRATLCPISSEDGPELWTVVESSRAHLSQWLPWVPLNGTPEASQRFADACVSDWNARRALRWAIRSHHTGTLLGMVGLERWVHATRSCDLGYWLCQEAAELGS